MNAVGIDLGSTCTKTAVLDGNGTLLYTETVPTGWNCAGTAEGVLERLRGRGFGEHTKCVATGYGHVTAPWADRTVTEITCHAKGASYLYGKGRLTVIDIGGQDTKVICVSDGRVLDFVKYTARSKDCLRPRNLTFCRGGCAECPC